MAQQSPCISIPKKTTEEVDWTTPIRHVIAQSYGENPDNYASECAALQRCRQDAVRGAGSDMTARDLLYKYFGQLELLELRFSEIKVTFPWHDAFTNKLTTQTSLAYEKASIIFQIAATHSSIAASQNRSDPEGLKRAFHYFRTSAGMLTYINDNFLHAPSTDLSRDVVKFLVGIVMAQATEVFFEKGLSEKKMGHALIAKVAAKAASEYTTLSEEVKEFMGKGIFDRNWVTIIQIKAKYFTSISQLYRAYADSAAGKHGDAFARYAVAETNAKEAVRLASPFGGMFVTQMSPNLPADAGSSIQELTKVQLTLCTEKKTEAQKENDLIYNAVIPPADTLPQIDKLTVATPIPIQEVYGTPDVQKTIGPDLFIKLIPLSVHESASVYSEEKAKLVRSEVERAETADGEVRSALDAIGVKTGLGRYKAMVEGLDSADNVPSEVTRMRDDIELVEQRESVNSLLSEINRLKENVQKELENIQRDLDIELRDCEAMRVKYEHMWTQAPSAGLTKSLRQDLRSHFSSLDAASSSDQQVVLLWQSIQGEIGILMSPQLEEIFARSAEQGPGGSLLDLDPSNEDRDDAERAKILQFVDEIEERLGRLNKINLERKNVLKDLKEKIQTDDVSHLLLLNRRNSNVEPTLFATELEKFKPYQSRLAATVHHEQVAVQEISSLWKSLKELAGRDPGARKWEEREKRKRDTMRRFTHARDVYMEIRDGIAKGLQFYHDLSDLSSTLQRNVKSFVSSRTSERDALVAQIETQKRLTASSQPSVPLPPPRPTSEGIDSAFATMNLNGPRSPPPLPPMTPHHRQVSYPQQQYQSPPPPPSQPMMPQSYGQASASDYQRSPPPPPPPPSQSTDPYASLFSTSSLPPQFRTNNPPSAPSPPQPPPPPSSHNNPWGNLPNSPPQQQQQQQYTQQQSYPPQRHTSQSNYGIYTIANSASPLPPPPPPINYQSQHFSPPPAQNYSPNVTGSAPPGAFPPQGYTQNSYGGYGSR